MLSCAWAERKEPVERESWLYGRECRMDKRGSVDDEGPRCLLTALPSEPVGRQQRRVKAEVAVSAKL